jgi:hypothetical protein
VVYGLSLENSTGAVCFDSMCLTNDPTLPIIRLNLIKWKKPSNMEGGFSMPNITLSVDDDIVKKVRKIAIDKNTTLTAMIREFLVSVTARDAQLKNEAVRKLNKSFKTISRDMGQRKWSREDLHER